MLKDGMHNCLKGAKFWKPSLFGLFFVALAWAAEPSGPEIVAHCTSVITSPPKRVPSPRDVDGPLLGNGDLGAVLAGPPEEQSIYLGKNDFWSQQQFPLPVGGLKLLIPELRGASYRQEQDILNAEVRGIFGKGDLTIRTRVWTAATENLLVTEMESERGSVSVTAAPFPTPARLRDNKKPINIGREQSGQGRWYFNGVIDEVRIYDRALAEREIGALARLHETDQGLVRRWGFDEEEGTTPQDTPVKLQGGPVCKEQWAFPYRSAESPIPFPARCRPLGNTLDYPNFALAIRGRGLKVTHERLYVDAGQAPPLKNVTVSAWIYIYSAGDANYILTKGEWNEAYSLGLDHGRLQFNVGDRFTRSDRPLPTQQWVHVAGTFDGCMVRAFVDGVEALPRARWTCGGPQGDTVWFTRNADGLLDSQEYRPLPTPTTATLGLRGREVTLAMRLIGAPGPVSEDGIHFDLKPAQKVYVVTSVLSDIDNRDHPATAKARLAGITLGEIERLQASHREWWRNFWSESFVGIGDPFLERSYYTSQYIMASTSRTGKVAPGLYGNWVTTDAPEWNGDYTLNYNYQTPYLGLYSSNHISTADPYDYPLLDFVNRGRTYARNLLNCRGIYYPGHIGPWGMERSFDYEPFMGQKSNTAFSAVPMLMRFYSTYDRQYASLIYSFVREVGQFWEDYLRFEGGRYVTYEDAVREAGPWRQGPRWWQHKDDFNSAPSLSFVRVVFKGLLDMSKELGVDAEHRGKWQDILDHLRAFPLQERNGKTVLRLTERGNQWDFPITYAIWPSGQIGLGSDPKLLEAARNTVAEWLNSPTPLFMPAMARVGSDPVLILDKLRAKCEKDSYPNSQVLSPLGGGVEAASIVPSTINEMLLQSHEGVLRLFPVWPKSRNARFGKLRAVGAFLVSSELVAGEVKSLTIESERGRECTLENPWPGKKVSLYRNGKKGERFSGPKITFKTGAGERIVVVPSGGVARAR
jgi:hypothetical protein